MNLYSQGNSDFPLSNVKIKDNNFQFSLYTIQKWLIILQVKAFEKKITLWNWISLNPQKWRSSFQRNLTFVKSISPHFLLHFISSFFVCVNYTIKSLWIQLIKFPFPIEIRLLSEWQFVGTNTLSLSNWQLYIMRKI